MLATARQPCCDFIAGIVAIGTKVADCSKCLNHRQQISVVQNQYMFVSRWLNGDDVAVVLTYVHEIGDVQQASLGGDFVHEHRQLYCHNGPVWALTAIEKGLLHFQAKPHFSFYLVIWCYSIIVFLINGCFCCVMFSFLQRFTKNNNVETYLWLFTQNSGLEKSCSNPSRQ